MMVPLQHRRAKHTHTHIKANRMQLQIQGTGGTPAQIRGGHAIVKGCHCCGYDDDNQRDPSPKTSK